MGEIGDWEGSYLAQGVGISRENVERSKPKQDWDVCLKSNSLARRVTGEAGFAHSLVPKPPIEKGHLVSGSVNK